MELHYAWNSGPLRVSWKNGDQTRKKKKQKDKRFHFHEATRPPALRQVSGLSKRWFWETVVLSPPDLCQKITIAIAEKLRHLVHSAPDPHSTQLLQVDFLLEPYKIDSCSGRLHLAVTNSSSSILTRFYLNMLSIKLQMETCLAGALCRECRELMRILITFLGKVHRNPSEYA